MNSVPGAAIFDLEPDTAVWARVIDGTGLTLWSGCHLDKIDPMPRTFAYVRVSTTGQTTENQIQEIEAAGFHVEPWRIITETVSGSTAIAQRRGFTRLMDRLESDEVLILTKLDRLGRDAIDVSSTVKALAEMGVRIHCFALGGVDLTSSAGTMTMNVLNAVAQFERALLIERTQCGLKRAKSEGKSLGRPSTLSEKQKLDVREDLETGMNVSAIARNLRQVDRRSCARDDGSRPVPS
ncbi:recombinase family protein [Mesorhizobium japonicum]|nr:MULTISPECIES: recombinase family protein [Mesorhizobium]